MNKSRMKLIIKNAVKANPVGRKLRDVYQMRGFTKNNAEKANYYATKTLRKVQKKVGFPERIR